MADYAPGRHEIAQEWVRKTFCPLIPADRFPEIREKRRQMGLDAWDREEKMIVGALRDLERAFAQRAQTRLPGV